MASIIICHRHYLLNSSIDMAWMWIAGTVLVSTLHREGRHRTSARQQLLCIRILPLARRTDNRSTHWRIRRRTDNWSTHWRIHGRTATDRLLVNPFILRIDYSPLPETRPCNNQQCGIRGPTGSGCKAEIGGDDNAV